MDEIIDMTATPVERAEQFTRWLQKKTQSGEMEWEELGANRHVWSSLLPTKEGERHRESSYLAVEFRGIVPTKSKFVARILADIYESSHSSAAKVTMGKYTYGIVIRNLRIKLFGPGGRFLPFLPPKELRAFGGDDLVFSSRSDCQDPVNLCVKVMEKYGVHHPASSISDADSLFSEINKGG